MTTLKPYISLDLETTGLDLGKSQILQIGAVYDDGVTPIKDLPTFNVLVTDMIDYWENGALLMHQKTGLLDRITIASEEETGKSIEDCLDALLDFIESHRSTKPNSDGIPSKFKINIAGKNVGIFDIPILKRWMSKEQLARWNCLVHPFCIDAGSVYFSDYGRIPSLSEIVRLIQSNDQAEVTHDALQDAIDVVTAIRHKMTKRD